MAGLREKVEAELEQMDQALRALPGSRRLKKLSVLELAGTASLSCNRQKHASPASLLFLRPPHRAPVHWKTA